MSYADELIAMLPKTETATNEAGQAEVAAAESTVTPEASTQAGAEMAAEGAGTATTETQQPAEAPAETPASQEAQTQAFDWSVFSERTNGLVTDEQSLTAFMEKATKFDEVLKAKEEIEANQFKPANDYITTLNKLVSEGASKDQVKAFIKLNDYGNLDELSDKDILIAHRVLIGNSSEEVAKYKIDNEYDFDAYEDDAIERKVLQDDMRVAAAKAKEDLKQYRSDLSTVVNPDREAAEQKRLSDIAAQKQYEDLVRVEAPKLSAKVDVAVAIPAGKEAEAISVPFSDNFKKEIPNIVNDFLSKTGLDPRDPATLDQINGWVEMRYIAENRDKFYSDLRNRVESEIAEKYANKYETKTGLPPEAQKPSNGEVIADQQAFFNSMVGLK